jgi:hypothetical protein
VGNFKFSNPQTFAYKINFDNHKVECQTCHHHHHHSHLKLLHKIGWNHEYFKCAIQPSASTQIQKIKSSPLRVRMYLFTHWQILIEMPGNRA